ncbi:TPA: YceK/YidQ family lipoprotein [Pseudomonas putida]
MRCSRVATQFADSRNVSRLVKVDFSTPDKQLPFISFERNRPMTFRYIVLMLAAASVTGCGTINTTFRDDAVASNKLARWHSHCDSVPRIYSGTVFNYCTLDAEPRRSTGFDGYPAPALIVLDMGLSAVTDTVVLPYSIYLQNKHGDIKKARLE